MKIAFLSTFYPFRGGIAQFNASLYHELMIKHEVKAYTFICQYPGVFFPGKTQYVQPNDHASVIASEAILHSMNPLGYLRAAKKIQAFSPDILLMKYWMPFFAPSLGMVAQKLKRQTKVVSILDNVVPHEPSILDKLFTRYFLKQQHGVVVMSKAVKQTLSQFKFPAERILEIPHPLYTHFGKVIPRDDALMKLNLDPKKRTLLFFGFIRSYKGLDVLLDAFADLDETYQLIIAGECYGSFSTYQEMIDRSPYKEQICLHNRYIGDGEVPLFFSAADVCILPYKSGTQSGISAIADYFTLPCIATNVGGLSESTLHNYTGYVLSDVNPQLLTKSIRKYFDNNMKKQFSKNIGKRNHEKSWDTFSCKLIDFTNHFF